VKRERLLAAVVSSIAVVAFFVVEWARARAAASIIDDWVRANVDGVQFAPEQYRVALPRLVRSLPLPAPLSVALIESISLGGIFAMLVRGFERGLVPFFVAVALPCVWLFSYARPETLPVSAYVVAMVSLASRPRWSSIALVATAAAVFVRADVPVVVGAAFVVTRVAPALGAAVMAEGLAAQAYLQLVAFPSAKYPPNVPRVQLLANLESPTSIACLLLVAAPLALAVLAQRRARVSLEAQDRVAIAAAALYAPLWLAFGSLREARIFVPFSFALVPTLTKIWSQIKSGHTH